MSSGGTPTAADALWRPSVVTSLGTVVFVGFFASCLLTVEVSVGAVTSAIVDPEDVVDWPKCASAVTLVDSNV